MVAATTTYATMLHAAGGCLCPWSSAAALGQQPLRASDVVAPTGTVLQVAALVGGLGHIRSSPCRWPGRGQLPLQGAWPWLVTLAEGLVMAGHPFSSLPSLRKCNKNM
ncbi:hypothetical protein GW17_00043050 [Ensete ventricosum]|nr:hypothetical protein GW17_00043050 [Ensete ventricosum]RZS20767.1 hypothetical protein BHM03_00053332 [Ensete ventricosum]